MFRYALSGSLVLLAGCVSSTATSVTPLAAPQSRLRADGSRQYVYWSNNVVGTVGRATLNGTGVNQTFIASITNGLVGGAGMTVNKSYIYWTGANGGSATTIARAKLDGTGVNKKFISGAHNPCGITVDANYVYWGGDAGSSIGRAKLDGTGVKQNFIATGDGVCGVVVTKTHIYWANYRANWIGRANIDGSSVNPNFISTDGADALAIVGSYIYWDNMSGTMGRAKIDGTDVKQTFIKGIKGETGFIAADKAHIYWTDWSHNSGTTIGRANIDGSGVNQKFISGTSGGFGIAITGGSP